MNEKKRKMKKPRKKHKKRVSGVQTETKMEEGGVDQKKRERKERGMSLWGPREPLRTRSLESNEKGNGLENQREREGPKNPGVQTA